MGIKTSFSIKDLENLSGIKAHTIRIWEKRYELLAPQRSDTNIRSYDSIALRKLLNVVMLVHNGMKISKISSLSENDIINEVKALSLHESNYISEINSFKVSMMELNAVLFENVYNNLISRIPVRDTFVNVIVPLLQEIGVLWTTNTIKPIHEHFISERIKEKLYSNISLAQDIDKVDDRVFALFLPMDEIHELAILYIHYELLSKGFQSIFFGRDLPCEDLSEVQKLYTNVTFVSYLTLEPKGGIETFVNNIHESVLNSSQDKFCLMGRNLNSIADKELPDRVTVYPDLLSFIEKI